MKKLFIGALTLSLGLGLFACQNKTTTKKTTTEAKPSTTKTVVTTKNTTTKSTTTEKKEEVKILTPAGTPLMAIGGLIGSDGVTIESVNGPELIKTEIVKDNYDMIIAPLTMGATLSIAEKTTYKLDTVLTTNNTYIISKGTTTLTNISDLVGKKLIAYGQNNTADIALKNALIKNEIDINDIDITYEADVATATSTFMNGSDFDYCLTAEPQITNLKVKKGATLNVLDLSNYMSSTVYQAGIFVNPNANQTRCDEVINEIKENVGYLNENPSEYASKVVDKNAFFTNLGVEALTACIPNANLVFIKAKENKALINAYFEELNAANPNILKGMVTDEFYR